MTSKSSTLSDDTMKKKRSAREKGRKYSGALQKWITTIDSWPRAKGRCGTGHYPAGIGEYTM